MNYVECFRTLFARARPPRPHRLIAMASAACDKCLRTMSGLRIRLAIRPGRNDSGLSFG
jgi:hypothetical protein